jgi:hypothetical protein
MSMSRFEHTTMGVKLFVNGVDNQTEYTVVTDPEEFAVLSRPAMNFVCRFVYISRKTKKIIRLAAEREYRLRRWNSIQVRRRSHHFFTSCYVFNCFTPQDTSTFRSIVLSQAEGFLDSLEGSGRLLRLTRPLFSPFVLTICSL